MEVAPKEFFQSVETHCFERVALCNAFVACHSYAVSDGSFQIEPIEKLRTYLGLIGVDA